MELIRPYPAAIIIILLSFNAQAATVSVSPQSQNAIEGSNFTVSVTLEPGGSSVYGAQFSLIFDKTKLEALSIEEGALLGSDGALTMEGAKTIDNSTGKINYSLVRKGTSTGISSSGTIAEITFRGLSAGTSALNFADVVISDLNASEIPSDTQAGNVTVAAVSTPTAAPTSTPTATTTATATFTPTATATATPGLTQTSTPVSGTPSQQGSTSGTSQAAISTIDRLELTYPNNTLVTLSSVGAVSEGDEFTVDAYIKSTEPVYGAEMKLLFDINYLEGIRIEQGDFLGGSMIVNSVSNENGEMVYAETRVGNVTGVKAKGVLARAMFRAKKAGNTAIELKNVKLINENEVAIKDVLSDSPGMNISRKAEQLDSLAVYWALLALISLVVIKRRLQI